MSRHPLWTAAPVRLAHSPGWLGLVMLAAALLVASLVTSGLFHTSARTSALDRGVAAAADAAAPGDSADLRAAWSGVLPPDAEDVVLGRLDALPGFGEPAVGATGTKLDRRAAPVVRAGGRTSPGTLFFHEGALEVLAGDDDAPGVWLPAPTAADLGLEVGDEVEVGFEGVPGSGQSRYAPTTLGGIYEVEPHSSLPARVASDVPGSEDWFLPLGAGRPGTRSPLVIASRETFGTLALTIREEPLFVADLAYDPGLGPAEAEVAVSALQQLAVDAFDGSTDLGGAVESGEPEPGSLQVASALPDLLAEADDAATSAGDQVGPYISGGQVLAAALLVAAWILVGQSRRREQSLAAGLGLHPVTVAGITALELLPVAVVAFPIGIGLGLLAIDVAGPPADLSLADLDTSDVVNAGLGALAVVVLPAVVAALDALRADLGGHRRFGGRVAAVPWEAFVLVATVLVAVGVLALDPARRGDSPLTTLFPLSAAASGAALVVRWAGRVSLPGARPAGARWLAARRSGQAGRQTRALTAVLAVTLGLFAYTLTVHRGMVEGADDKAAALVGAPTVVDVGESLAGRGEGSVEPPLPGSTLVWSQRVVLPPAFGAQPLLAVDTRTFADVADWGSSGALDRGRELLGRLTERSRRVPVILAGNTYRAEGDRGRLEIHAEASAPYVVVAVIPAFPGSEGPTGNVTVIADSRRLFKVLPPQLDARDPAATEAVAGAFTASVWSTDTASTVRRSLAAADLPPGEVRTSDAAAVSSGLLGAAWAARYVVVLGLVVLALALAAALALALRLAERDAVADVLLARMGWRPRELAAARTWEVVRAVVTATVATAVSLAALLLAPSTIDHLTSVLPTSRPRVGVPELGAVLALALLMVAAAAVVGAARARRRSSAEVLRDV